MHDVITHFGGDFGLQPLDPVRAELHHRASFDVNHMVVVRRAGGFKPGRRTLERMALNDALLLQLGQGAVDRRQRHPGVARLHPLVQFGGVRMIHRRGQNLGQHRALTGHPQARIAHRLFKIAGFVGKQGHTGSNTPNPVFRKPFGPAFQLPEPLGTGQTAAIAQDVTEKLIATTPDLIGVFISGGGMGKAVADPKLATRSVIIRSDIVTSENLQSRASAAALYLATSYPAAAITRSNSL